MCTEDFSVAESVVASSPPKRKKDTTICGVLNGKILAHRSMRERTPSLLKSERKSKKFLCLPLGQMLQSHILKKKKWRLPKRKALSPKKREMSLWRQKQNLIVCLTYNWTAVCRKRNMPPKNTSSFSPKRIWKKKYLLLGERAIIGSNLPLPFSKRPTKPKNTLNKKIPKGFGIFSKRLVRTSALPTGRFRSPSKMLGFSRGNTRPGREARRQPLSISLNVKLGGEGGI